MDKDKIKPSVSFKDANISIDLLGKGDEISFTKTIETLMRVIRVNYNKNGVPIGVEIIQ